MKKQENTNNDENNLIEKLMEQAFQGKAERDQSPEALGECLSDASIHALHAGTLPENQRQMALEHLDKCQHCCNDLAFYYEIMNPQEQTSVLTKLKRLRDLLPQLVAKLDTFDFTSLCRRVSSVSKEISEGGKLKLIDLMTNEILRVIGSKFPSVVVQVRGATEIAKDETEFSHERLIKAGKKLQETINQHMNVANRYLQQGDCQCAENPERWIFEHLTDSMTERATCIRDWCEERLELMNIRPEMRHLPSLGVGCSKQLLRCAVDILKAFEGHFPDPLSYFIVYTGAYCCHLGMILSENEEICRQKYKSHGKDTWDFMMGNSDLSISPAWQVMGFSSPQEAMLIANICAGKQKNSTGNFTELAETQSIFLDGSTMNISPIVLAQVLRLTNLLNYNLQRLPSRSYLQQFSIPEQLIGEYLKHEFIDQVKVNESGIFSIKMRQRFHYPDNYDNLHITIRNDIEKEIKDIQTALRRCGIKLPSPEIDWIESLFLEQHPYLIHPK